MGWEIASATDDCLTVADLDLVVRMACRDGSSRLAPVNVCWELRGDILPVVGSYGFEEIVLRTSPDGDRTALTVAGLVEAARAQNVFGKLYAEIEGEENLYGVRSLTFDNQQLLISVYAGDAVRL